MKTNKHSKPETSTIIKLIKRIPFARSIYRYHQWQQREGILRENYPRGHYYSPLPDVQWTREHFDSIYCPGRNALPGIDLAVESQKELFRNLQAFFESYDFPEQKIDGYRYYSNNPMFGKGSAFILYSMIRHF